MKEITFGFNEALALMKKGHAVSRVQFKDTCIVKAQYPTPDLVNTLPYLVMIKKIQTVTKDNEIVISKDIFPVNLSCESIFAEDWYVVQ